MAAIAHPLTASKSTSFAAVVFLGRVFFALLFILGGLNHFKSATIANAASQGAPIASISVPFSGALALVGGLSILIGYRAKLGALLIAVFLLGVTPVMHPFWNVADPMMHQLQWVMFMKNLSMLGGALLITQFGAGPWSLDNRAH